MGDRAILIEALKRAISAYYAANPRPTLLGPGPDKEILAALSAAIEKTEAYKAVDGRMLFSGASGPVLHAESLASNLFSRARYGDDANRAVDDFVHMLTTDRALGLFKGAIWGVNLDAKGALGRYSMVPFAELPDTYMKTRILERAQKNYDGSPWLGPRYFDAPPIAFMEEVPEFPYISNDGSPFVKVARLERKAHELGALIQSATVGKPIAIATWFEYADPKLEYAVWDNQLTWLIPEVAPRIDRNVTTKISVLQRNYANFDALNKEQQLRLLRSMERFQLSQCRTDIIDRVLDLALAFEIAVSDKGDNAPPTWKVSVRSSQLIGGPLQLRQQNRLTLSSLYYLRNQATHGGTLKATSKSVDEVLEENCKLFVELVRKLLSLRLKPDWKSVELEPPADSNNSRP